MGRVPVVLILAILGTAVAVRVRAGVLVVNPAVKSADDANPGTEEKPFRTISAAAAVAEAGDTVLIHGGIYRESVMIAHSGTADRPIRFVAATGESVVVTGADRLTRWRKETSADAGTNVFSTEWPHSFINFNKSRAHPDDDRHLLIGRAEQVIVHGYALRQVLTKDGLTRGTFWVDSTQKRLWACASDNSDLSKPPAGVEASVRTSVWDCRGEHVVTKGITFRYAASMAQRGMAQFSGAGAVVEDCTFEFGNSAGATFTGTDIVVRRCVFRENGQLGFGGSGAHRLTMSDCIVRGNNTKDFDRGWEAGGMKICASRGVVLERCVFSDNRGTGVWFDIGNEACTVRNCLIERNEDGGIFYEISFGLHAHDNVIVENGLAETPGAWAVWAGICLSSSPDCVLERNLIVGNKEGLSFREQMRTTPTIEDKSERAVWNHDNVVRSNVFAYNRDAQVAGWFDVKDQRHWPAAMREKGAVSRAAGEDIAKNYLAKNPKGQPVDLSLEKLKLTLASNVYSVSRGEGLINWGPSWGRHRNYTSLDDVRRELAFEAEGVLTELPFVDAAARDFRVMPSHVTMRMNCMPRGEVPGVKIGMVAP